MRFVFLKYEMQQLEERKEKLPPNFANCLVLQQTGV